MGAGALIPPGEQHGRKQCVSLFYKHVFLANYVLVNFIYVNIVKSESNIYFS